MVTEINKEEKHIVLARKYRPKMLSELVGQDIFVKTISNAIKTYNEDKVFKEVFNEPSIFSKAWSKLTTAASTVGGGIKTAGGKVLSGAKAVRSGIVKGGRLLGKGALAVATSPKYIVPKSWRSKIYYKLKKIFPGKKAEEIDKFMNFEGVENFKELKNMDKSIDIINNANINDEDKKNFITNSDLLNNPNKIKSKIKNKIESGDEDDDDNEN